MIDQNRKGQHGLIAICVLCVVLIGFIIYQATDSMVVKLWLGAYMNGLESVKVSVDKHDIIWKTYTVSSENLEDLTFEEILQIDEKLSSDMPFGCTVKYICNDDIYECNTTKKIVEKNGKEVYNDYKSTELYKEELEKEKERAKCANIYPYVGMREEYLTYTILGKPNKIEKCRDFEHFRASRKTKTYTWHETEEHGTWYVTVGYAEYIPGYGYKEYPTNNGIVIYMTYTEKGKAPVTVY